MIAYPPTKQQLPQGLRIVCVKWGDKYGEDYVHKLQAACERHIPHREFVCLTENPVMGVQCNPLPSDLPGWWSKIGLFRPGLFPGDNLYLDLDVVVTGQITPFLAALKTDPLKLWALDDFSYSLIRHKQGMSAETQRLLGGAGTINSSVMLWRGQARSPAYAAWERFTPDVMDTLHGDQNWLTQCLWPDHIKLLPTGYAESYKYGGRKQAPIVIFHGDPKPSDVTDDWVLRHWAA